MSLRGMDSRRCYLLYTWLNLCVKLINLSHQFIATQPNDPVPKYTDKTTRKTSPRAFQITWNTQTMWIFFLTLKSKVSVFKQPIKVLAGLNWQVNDTKTFFLIPKDTDLRKGKKKLGTILDEAAETRRRKRPPHFALAKYRKIWRNKFIPAQNGSRSTKST